MIENRLVENNQCPICYDDPTNITIVDCCKTAFCLECITMCLKHKTECPHCRAKLGTHNLIVSLPDDAAPADDEIRPPELQDKIHNMKSLLDDIYSKNTCAKVLVFSEHENIFREIGEYLNINNINNSRLMGSGAHIANVIKQFKNTEDSGIHMDLLMLNSRYCGSGLNIENATDVIIYHSMTPELEMQVIGRAQRPGRTNVLNVWKLQHENEMEKTQ
jgi:SNF2 family DNA or RNA helicase